MDVSNWGYWATLAVMLIGLIGALLPGIPGVLLIWLAALVYGLVGHFVREAPLAFAGITVLAVIGASADIWVSNSLGRLGGASSRALLMGMLGGFVGLIVGLFFAGVGAVPGALIGTIGSIMYFEYRRQGSVDAAVRAGAGWALGYLASALVEFAAGVLMILLFIWSVGGPL